MTAPGLVTVDLGALAGNWRAIRQRVAPARCGAVVKADGYGLGAPLVGRTLYAAGCRDFFVAQASEGAALRAALREADASIVVLDGLEPQADAAADYVAHRLIPAIGSEEELARWRKRAPDAVFALHVDTGMKRLGFDSAAALEAAIGRHGAEGAVLLMSHFVSSECPEDPINAAQLARFEAARR